MTTRILTAAFETFLLASAIITVLSIAARIL
jgi:hypothetical protein